MEEIGNEFVVALEVEVADVEEDDGVAGIETIAKDINGTEVADEQGAEVSLDHGDFDHFGHAASGDFWDELGDEVFDRCGFDDESKLHGGLGEIDGGLGRWELSAVNDIGPSDELGDGLSVETEFLRGDGGEELGAGFVFGIVEFFAGVIAAEVLGVFGLEEGALVVIEPPSKAGRAGVLEVDDGVLVAVEDAVLERV